MENSIFEKRMNRTQSAVGSRQSTKKQITILYCSTNVCDFVIWIWFICYL